MGETRGALNADGAQARTLITADSAAAAEEVSAEAEEGLLVVTVEVVAEIIRQIQGNFSLFDC